MIVGFMRNFKNPTYMAKLTAMLCKYHDLDLIYLRPEDVNLEDNSINGKMYIDNKWIEVKTELPSFIDISQYCFKRKNNTIINYLRKNTLLSDNRRNILSKKMLQNQLLKSDIFKQLVIPTHNVEEFGEILKWLDKYASIVLKPIKGERGKGVYVLRKEKLSYVIGYQKEEKKYSYEGLKDFFAEFIKNKQYMLQKYISSRSIQGDPFDCRVHVEKNAEGKWTIARKFIRIGIGQKVTSNLSQGGSISDTEPFLKANFGEEWEGIDWKLNELGDTLPYHIEKLRKTNIMSMGMDIGIERDGKLYLFEINGAPITGPLRSEAAMLRTEYYKYILGKI